MKQIASIGLGLVTSVVLLAALPQTRPLNRAPAGFTALFNGKPTVDGQALDNYFNRDAPVLPTGAIELQTHGSEIRFRNIYIREIPATEAK